MCAHTHHTTQNPGRAAQTRQNVGRPGVMHCRIDEQFVGTQTSQEALSMVATVLHHTLTGCPLFGLTVCVLGADTTIWAFCHIEHHGKNETAPYETKVPG
eukprot:TRINITY_DN34292_c0_g1_i1.p3 TRINITY_DN34292_c0_g1~~TRINITY_DN34292_c0_g1_i1.p3  ORF type:complete len:100 (-),score=10.71 TRINITY_DN34292_c0_g1_i1:41-340(-)